jgi:hypothetical protein
MLSTSFRSFIRSLVTSRGGFFDDKNIREQESETNDNA